MKQPVKWDVYRNPMVYLGQVLALDVNQALRLARLQWPGLDVWICV